jgi:hypothetical protein
VSREDANLVVAILSLVVAVVASWVSVRAIRRDRPDLRVTDSDAGAGQRYLTIVNVGTQPVRIEHVVVQRVDRPWPFLRWNPTRVTPATAIFDEGRPGQRQEELPVALNPAAAVVLWYSQLQFEDWLEPRRRWWIFIEDAAGNSYKIRQGPRGVRSPATRRRG